MIENTIVAWHECVKTGDPVKLGRILHDDVVFHSPVVFTPQRGKAVTSKYLLAAFQVLNGDDFTYVREVVGSSNAMLEFTTTIDGIVINGVDIIRELRFLERICGINMALEKIYHPMGGRWADHGFQGDGASVESSQPAPSDDGRNACQILLISMFFSALFRIMTNDD